MGDVKKVGIAQISAKANDLDYNTRKVIRILEENKDRDIIVFPELILQGHHHNRKNRESESSIDVGTLELIQEACTRHDAAVVVGALEVVEDKHYNCAFYIDENKIDRYIKTHVHWTEDFTPGHQLRCINTRMGKLGMLVCYDSAFTEIGRCLALMGAQIFAVIGVVPTEFNQKYMIRRLQAMAVNNQVYVLYANKWKKDKYNGGSCIIDPRGKVLGQLGDKEGVLNMEIDMHEVISWREEEKIYPYRRPELYHKLVEKI